MILDYADSGQAFLRLVRRTGPDASEQTQEVALGPLPRTRYAAYGVEKLQLAAGDLDGGLEAQAVTAGVLVGGRVGFHHGFSQSESVSTCTIIQGVVPPIPAGRRPSPTRWGSSPTPRPAPMAASSWW